MNTVVELSYWCCRRSRGRVACVPGCGGQLSLRFVDVVEVAVVMGAAVVQEIVSVTSLS